jgi:hypothetical protein
MFRLQAQVLGAERSASADADGYGGITVHFSGGVRHVGTANEAIRIARDDIGEFLRRAQRPGVPWGLLVVVSDGQAVYGEWPLTGGGGGSPSFQRTPLVRIRNRWHDSGALSALENAIRIIREYAPKGRAAA